MSNRYNRKGDKIKWAFTGIAFVLVFVLLTGMCLQLFGKGKVKPSEWFKKTETKQTETVPEDNGGAVVNESRNNGISVMSTKLLTSEYAANGISEQADSAYKLTATITPSDALLSGVDWSVSWVNAESEWATGKTVTDYVTVTPTIDGALTANVECKQAFGEQINVQVVSRDVKSVTADCTVDYRKKVVGINLGQRAAFGNQFLQVSAPLYAENADIDENNVTFNSFYKGVGKMVFPVTYFDRFLPVYSVYTVDDTFTSKEVFQVNNEYINYLKSGGITVNDEIHMYYSHLFAGSYFFYGSITSGSITYQNPLGVSSDQLEQALAIARQHTDIPAFSFTFKFSSDYSSFEKTYDFYFAESSLVGFADNISLDNSNLVF